MPGDNVKVAVRVRPFNSREKTRNAKLIIQMNGGTTTITNPEEPNEEPKKFAFDYSYWSHDGYIEQDDGLLVPNGPKYADQARVFEELGKGVLTNAWDGYNSCLFAYGQTGSGKSFSMVGYGCNKGIVPIFCDQLFVGINQKKEEGSKTEFEVSFSMLEIYNEQVRDLLNPSSNKKGGLKIRESPKIGFYAVGLKQTPVQSYSEIQDRMDEGTRNRTVAATQMNATSSRAHTIVGIKFTQKSINDAGQEMAKTAVCNLVDLAGSERAESTGATGDRLKEGAAINQSLSSLGNCIAALADKAKGKNVKVPYRDSVLTKLLKNALGGNSKTIMIAALSPADINYEETLSTLRYADRAKQIKNVAVVNEDPTEKLIRELKEENQRLMEALKKGGLTDLGGDDDEEKQQMTEEEKEALRKELEEEMQARLRDTEAEMEEMKKTWEEKLKQAQASAGQDSERQKKEARKTKPHMYNLNMDNQLSGMIVYLLDQSTYRVGNNKADNTPDIVLNGLSIQKEHAALYNEDGRVYIEKSSPEAKLLVNGDPVISKLELDHNDRIMFGSNHLYVFQHPELQKANPNKYTVITYEMAQEEIAQKNGFDMSAKQSTGMDLKKAALGKEPWIRPLDIVPRRTTIHLFLANGSVTRSETLTDEPSAESPMQKEKVCDPLQNISFVGLLKEPEVAFQKKYYIQTPVRETIDEYTCNQGDDDSCIEGDISHEKSKGSTIDEYPCSSDDDDDSCSENDSSSEEEISHKKPKGKRQKWTEAATALVEKYFEKYITIEGTGCSGKLPDEKLLQQDLIDMIPAIEEANAISEELGKKVKFEILMISARGRGLQHGRTEVFVKMLNKECDLEYTWDKDKFTRRKYLMQEMYQNYQEGEDWHLPDEKDPFTEPPDMQVQIGAAQVYLQSLAYLIETKESVLVSNFQGQDQGLLDVELIPCNDSGKELSEADDVFVEDPKDLIGRSVNFVVKIPGATGIPSKFKDIHCRYKIFLDTNDNMTDKMGGSVSLEFKHRKYFNFKVATSQLVDYLNNGVLIIQVWGVQKSKQSTSNKQMDTKMAVATSQSKETDNMRPTLESTAHILQVAALKKQNERLRSKIDEIKKIVDVAEKYNKERIQTAILKQVLHAPTSKISGMAIAKIPLDDQSDHSYEEKSHQSSSVCILM